MIENEVNPLLEISKPEKKATSGRKYRSYQRQLHVYSVNKKTIQLIKTHLPGLAYLPIRTDKYVKKIIEILNVLEKEFPAPNDHYRARFILALLIERGNENKLWELEPPTIPIKLRRHQQKRTLGYHNSPSNLTF